MEATPTFRQNILIFLLASFVQEQAKKFKVPSNISLQFSIGFIDLAEKGFDLFWI